MIPRIRSNQKANNTYDYIIQELTDKVETTYNLKYTLSTTNESYEELVKAIDKLLEHQEKCTTKSHRISRIIKPRSLNIRNSGS